MVVLGSNPVFNVAREMPNWNFHLYIISYVLIYIYIEREYVICRLYIYIIGGSRNGDIPKWMVYNCKSQSKMDDLEVALFQETSHGSSQKVNPIMGI